MFMAKRLGKVSGTQNLMALIFLVLALILSHMTGALKSKQASPAASQQFSNLTEN